MRMACPPAGMNVKRAEHAADGTADALCAGAPTCCMQEWHMPHACPMRAPYWRAWKCACIDVGVGGDADGMSTCGHECEEGRTCCGRDGRRAVCGRAHMLYAGMAHAACVPYACPVLACMEMRMHRCWGWRGCGWHVHLRA